MSKFPWKTALAGTLLLSATVYAFAQLAPGSHDTMRPHRGMSDQMGPQAGMTDQMGPQGGMEQMGPMRSRMMEMHKMHGERRQMGPHAGMHDMHSGLNGATTLPGNDAFGAVQEVVRSLEADPATDWSKVDIAALREHLIDMNEVTLNAKAETQATDTGVTISVTGEGRTLVAIKRMVPAHVAELRALGWTAATEDMPNGVKLTVASADLAQRTKLKALGFLGIMVQGAHHAVHHLAMAKGEFVH
jgi:hypothetical protein